MVWINKSFLTIFILAISASHCLFAQQIKNDSTTNWTYHFQSTIIGQKHSGFSALYNGNNSLADSVEPTAVSLTTTLFLGRKLWNGAALYVDPEASGGKGLSFAKGVAGALNGETYRVGETAPQVFMARAYLQQSFALNKSNYEVVEDDANQLGGKLPASRITISAGKFAISDFFDDNAYSKDPRTQFFNWSLWANGAWDYPANTRGYTFGVVAELIKPTWAFRVSTVAVPRIANFHLMEYRFSKAHSETFEFEHQLSINSNPGTIRFILTNTLSQAPSYAQALQAVENKDSFLLHVIQGNAEHKTYGGKKFGIGFNIEQALNNDIGFFSRLGWNDGKYVSWAFTEIDRTANLGFSIKGTKWKRPDDIIGIAGDINGISKDHREFLKEGGYGFLIGDGTLTYGNEVILETYYNARLTNFLWLTFDYQFVNNPGYNKDRGPTNVFALRAHVQL